MSHVPNIASKSAHWLRTITTSEASTSLKDLGLLLCDNIQDPGNFPVIRGGGTIDVMLISPYELITWDREKLTSWANEISIADVIQWDSSVEESKHWSQCLGSIALSYAREGDLSVTAALIRVSARLNLRGIELSDAIHFLIDQQQPDGSFGLLAREFAIANQEHPTDVLIRLTVEMLWAIDEIVHRTDDNDRAGNPIFEGIAT